MRDATETPSDPQHFTKAVTELGEIRPVLTTSAIFNDKGVKIIEKGVAINAGMYERLMQHKLSEPIENSVSSLPTVSGAFLRESAEKLLQDEPFFARMTEDPKLRTLLLDVIHKIPLPGPMAFQLTLACEVRPEVFLHSVQVALIAAWLARTPTALRFDIGMAAAAGLLHDIGMLHLDPVLLQPTQGLSSGQRRQLYSHPLIATVLLKRHPEYTKDMVRAVAEHHESLNGSGYPSHLVGDGISPLGRIVALAEVVAAMFTREHLAPEMRLSVLLRMNKHRFDATLVTKVMQLLRPEVDASNALSLEQEDPIARLCEIEDAISNWPIGLMKLPDLSKERLAGLNALATQAEQLQRALATVGIAREQLVQLRQTILDDTLKLELSLLAQEAAWQLRTMARQTRRRWRAGPSAIYPDALKAWLDRVDAMVADGAPATAMDEVSTEP
ncbi:MAG: HD domain-containing phosphohydrolase [Pseudomonadota bacterium]